MRHAAIPYEQDRSEVRMRGEPLHPVIWQGRQWAVTEFGIECRDGTYSIAAARLPTLRHGTDRYDWPMHMAEKNWVDMDDFTRAFRVGLQVHHGIALEAAA